MGNKGSNSVNTREMGRDKDENIAPTIITTKSSFDFLYVIGRGGFGKVILFKPGLESIS
jgi:hypothetical protein